MFERIGVYHNLLLGFIRYFFSKVPSIIAFHHYLQFFTWTDWIIFLDLHKLLWQVYQIFHFWFIYFFFFECTFSIFIKTSTNNSLSFSLNKGQTVPSLFWAKILSVFFPFSLKPNFGYTLFSSFLKVSSNLLSFLSYPSISWPSERTLTFSK